MRHATTALCLSLGLLVAACSTSGLAPLLLEGPDLHASLETRPLDGAPIRHVHGDVITGNPQLSTDADFVAAIARSSSQGRLGSEGIRAALYALYQGEEELGIYGLEAASEADASRREEALRAIWAHNARLDRARVHRGGLVVVVVWHDGVSPGCWEAVNAKVAERLAGERSGGS